LYTSVFNLLSKAQPFAAILIAYGTHCFFERVLLRPEGPVFEAESRGGVLGERAASAVPTS